MIRLNNELTHTPHVIHPPSLPSIPPYFLFFHALLPFRYTRALAEMVVRVANTKPGCDLHTVSWWPDGVDEKGTTEARPKLNRYKGGGP